MQSDFAKYFSNDSLFQVSRIDFPIKVQESDWKKDYDLSEVTITKSEYQKHDFSDKEPTPTDNYTQEIKVTNNKATIEIRGVDNGIMADYYFEKINGKWKLITWVDSST